MPNVTELLGLSEGDRLKLTLSDDAGELVGTLQETPEVHDPETVEDEVAGWEQEFDLPAVTVDENPTSHGWETLDLTATKRRGEWSEISVEAWVWEGDYVSYPVDVDSVEVL